MKKIFIVVVIAVLYCTVFIKHVQATENSWENVGIPGFSDNVVYASILRKNPQTKELHVAYAE